MSTQNSQTRPHATQQIKYRLSMAVLSWICFTVGAIVSLSSIIGK
jgi:hypothetical protein